MKLQSRIENNVLVIDISGRIDPSVTAPLEQELGQAMSTPHPGVLLNLQNMEYVSSGGLRVFLTTLKKVNAEKRKLKLCCLNSNISKIFQIAGFAQLFDIAQSEEEALGKFSD